MARSNENESLVLGTYIGSERLKTYYFPIVKNCVTGVELIYMGKVIPFSLSLYNTLSQMTPKEQWDWLCEKDIRTPRKE